MNNQEVKLKTLLSTSIQNGYSPICPEEPNGAWVLGLGALTDNGINTDGKKPAPLNDKTVERFLLKHGDFLISRSNTSDKVGRSILYKGEIENCSYPDLMMKFRVDETKIYPEYLEFYLRSPKAIKYLQASASGTSSTMVKITKTTIEKLPVWLPSYERQILIANVWRSINQAITTTEQLIAAKQQYLNILHQKFFQPNDLNKYWKSIKISTFLASRNEKAVPSKEIPLYSLTIENGVTAKTDRYNREFLVRDSDVKEYKIVYDGDIVFNPSNLRWGAIARSNVGSKVVVSPIYEILEIDYTKVNGDFIAHALTCSRQIAIFATKSEGTLIERMAVKIDTFLSSKILLPEDINEQTKIAEILNTAKREIDLLKKLAESYRIQKRGLMQKLLSGEWRVAG